MPRSAPLRVTLSDWKRDSVAAALQTQRKTLALGLIDFVDPEEDTLSLSYRVDGKFVKETSFFRRIAKDALSVAPELRELLMVYIDQLGTGGEGVQPWQDPDKGVGGLGPALYALALIDPDCLDVLRAYLETRDGEHEGYSLDVVVPGYLRRHGWRDEEALRFGIYATLNRFWGGRRPPRAFDGMFATMAKMSAPIDIADAVLMTARHFGNKPKQGLDTAAYCEAFCTLLDPDQPFEVAVLDALRDDPSPA